MARRSRNQRSGPKRLQQKADSHDLEPVSQHLQQEASKSGVRSDDAVVAPHLPKELKWEIISFAIEQAKASAKPAAWTLESTCREYMGDPRTQLLIDTWSNQEARKVAKDRFRHFFNLLHINSYCRQLAEKALRPFKFPCQGTPNPFTWVLPRVDTFFLPPGLYTDAVWTMLYAPSAECSKLWAKVENVAFSVEIPSESMNIHAPQFHALAQLPNLKTLELDYASLKFEIEVGDEEIKNEPNYVQLDYKNGAYWGIFCRPRTMDFFNDLKERNVRVTVSVKSQQCLLQSHAAVIKKEKGETSRQCKQD
ncbi:hypothetical protein GCG54_00004339 [Colletotrichum gloeosporioides]|uniref:Uncharacterized protein n=1 Tax=Colletotrichum gloeosporioides TaxID=474922 RepID=A0A8H4FL15_COLGL|nr:uncharacterized protein GCG54_00004339 [Colletotrichum gloeosporioides]KAF3806015.1 hypothetical protein GCG54_00004339 [Colletotrichum gloeosporioides]